MIDNDNPPIKFCPYCGSDKVAIKRRVPRCTDCRRTFFVSYTRKLRKAPTKR